MQFSPRLSSPARRHEYRKRLSFVLLLCSKYCTWSRRTSRIGHGQMIALPFRPGRPHSKLVAATQMVNMCICVCACVFVSEFVVFVGCLIRFALTMPRTMPRTIPRTTPRAPETIGEQATCEIVLKPLPERYCLGSRRAVESRHVRTKNVLPPDRSTATTPWAQHQPPRLD